VFHDAYVRGHGNRVNADDVKNTWSLHRHIVCWCERDEQGLSTSAYFFLTMSRSGVPVNW